MALRIPCRKYIHCLAILCLMLCHVLPHSVMDFKRFRCYKAKENCEG